MIMDAGWWREGNELFTPAFVLRMLEYQPVAYYFDEDYKVRVMDMTCNIIELTSNMYIVVTEEGYEWRREEVFPPEETDGYIAENESMEFVEIDKKDQ